MNGTLTEVEVLTKGIVEGLRSRPGVAEAVVCPPFVYLGTVSGYVKGTDLGLGAQNVCEHGSGAYTGEIAAGMLGDFGCRYVIVGHSERRALYRETDATIAEKFALVQSSGMVPILCVGETLAEREAGETESVIARQVDAVTERLGAESLTRGVIAYEPVWAIGTGQNASPEQANAVHEYIRDRIGNQDAAGAGNVRIIYGGSVKSDNCAGLFAMPGIDGGLIGGASLKAEEFLKIYRAAV